MHSTYFCSEPWQRYGGGGSKRRRCDDGRLWCTRVPKNPRPNSCGGDRAAGRRHRRRATVLLPTTARGRAARRCAEADFGRTYRESNRGCRRRYVAHRHRHVARCRRRARGCSRYVTAAAIVRAEDSTVLPPSLRRTPPPSCRALPPHEAVAAMSPPRAIVRAEDSTVPTSSSSALLSWYGCYKQGRLQLVLRKYSFFVFFSSLLRTFCWSPLANAFKKVSR